MCRRKITLHLHLVNDWMQILRIKWKTKSKIYNELSFWEVFSLIFQKCFAGSRFTVLQGKDYLEIVIFPWNDITIILFIIKIIMMTTIKIIFIVISIKNKIRSIVLLANAWEHSYKCPCSSKLCYALIGWLHLMLFF